MLPVVSNYFGLKRLLVMVPGQQKNFGFTQRNYSAYDFISHQVELYDEDRKNIVNLIKKLVSKR